MLATKCAGVLALAVAFASALTLMAQSPSNEAPDKPDMEWDIPADDVWITMEANGWRRAVALPGTEVELPLEIAVSEEYGAVGQRLVIEGVVRNGTVTTDDMLGGPFLTVVDHERLTYQTIRLSGDLERDVARASDLYNLLVPVSRALSDAAVRAIVLERYSKHCIGRQAPADRSQVTGRQVNGRHRLGFGGALLGMDPPGIDEIEQPTLQPPPAQLRCE